LIGELLHIEQQCESGLARFVGWKMDARGSSR